LTWDDGNKDCLPVNQLELAHIKTPLLSYQLNLLIKTSTKCEPGIKFGCQKKCQLDYFSSQQNTKMQG